MNCERNDLTCVYYPDHQRSTSGKEKAAEAFPEGHFPQYIDYSKSRLPGSSINQVIQGSDTSKTTRAEESVTLEYEEGEARGELIEEQRVCCFCSNRFVKS
jgi:hypothetical protein